MGYCTFVIESYTTDYIHIIIPEGVDCLCVCALCICHRSNDYIEIYYLIKNTARNY